MGKQRQRTGSLLAPKYAQNVVAKGTFGADQALACQPGHDIAAAQGQKPAHQIEARGERLALALRPVERGLPKRSLRKRIGGWPRALRLHATVDERRTAAVPHRVCKRAAEIAKERERLSRAPLFAHEQQRRRRCK